jgi:hypothetical protein
LLASRASAGLHSARHTQDKSPDQPAGYSAPALLQRAAKAILLFLAPHIVVILRIEFVYALLKMPLEVLNRVEVG